MCVKVGEEGFSFIGVRLHSKGVLIVVDVGGGEGVGNNGAGFAHKVLLSLF